MIITNKYNLPEVLVRFAQGKHYSRGDAHRSVTQLINSPRIVALEERHHEELEQDISDVLFSLLGTATHYILDKYSDESTVIREQRMFATVNGWRISGAMDRQEITAAGRIIEDWKVTSVYAVMNEKIDWEYQLNCYAFLVRLAGHRVCKLMINAVIRDWAKRNVGKVEGYPPAPLHQIEIPLWTFEEQEAFVKERIALHAATVMDDPPLCTPDERWMKPSTWAVQKPGAKRALKVFLVESEAQEMVVGKKDLEVVHRPGVNTRCLNFCRVRQFCDFGKQLGESNEADSNSAS